MNRILVAGVGNVFFGDDGFGVAVARRLAAERLPAGTRVSDFGIRGVHLAYELLEPIDLLIVVDLAARGGSPGTLYVIEPEVDRADPPVAVDGAHGMDVCAVFASVRALGGTLPRVVIVGCEPACLDPRMALSPEVEGAVPGAIQLVHELAQRELQDTTPDTANPIPTEAPT